MLSNEFLFGSTTYTPPTVYPFSFQMRAVCYGDGGYVAVSDSGGGNGLILQSYDGYSWFLRRTTNYRLNDVIWVNGTPGYYFAVGYGSQAYYSSNGLAWYAIIMGNMPSTLENNYAYTDSLSDSRLNVSTYRYPDLRSINWYSSASQSSILNQNNWFSLLISQTTDYSFTTHCAVREPKTNYVVIGGYGDTNESDIILHQGNAPGYLILGYSSYSVTGTPNNGTNHTWVAVDVDKTTGAGLLVGGKGLGVGSGLNRGIVNGFAAPWSSSRVPQRGDFVTQTVSSVLNPDNTSADFSSVIYNNSKWLLSTYNGKIIIGTGNPGATNNMSFVAGTLPSLPGGVSRPGIVALASKFKYKNIVSNQVIAVGGNGLIMISEDNGSTFTIQNLPGVKNGVLNNY